jgi:hypothetical protein
MSRYPPSVPSLDDLRRMLSLGEKVREAKGGKKRKKKPPYGLASSKRMEGIRLAKRWGLVQCGWRSSKNSFSCSQLLIVEDGQKTVFCPRCGKRRWLFKHPVISTSDDQAELRKKLVWEAQRIANKKFPIQI